MKQKNYNIEIMRVAAFVMVIVIHVSNYFCRAYGTISNGEYIYSLVINSLARVSVPCFFMMSGALLLGRTESMSKNMKRVGRFLMVLVIWSIIYYLFNTYYSHQDTFGLSNFLEKPAEAHLWYLYASIFAGNVQGNGSKSRNSICNDRYNLDHSFTSDVLRKNVAVL